MTVDPSAFLWMIPFVLTVAIWSAGYFTLYDEPFSLYSDHWFVALLATVCSMAIWTLFDFVTEAFGIARVAVPVAIG